MSNPFSVNDDEVAEILYKDQKRAREHLAKQTGKLDEHDSGEGYVPGFHHMNRPEEIRLKGGKRKPRGKSRRKPRKLKGGKRKPRRKPRGKSRRKPRK
jgi:hypothetical protein